ncbi:flaG family protein [Collimonas arenae]|uniref:FlaG family protein n=1 Tax=Collimonas arenae TaxID=279058 RepID=A0A127QG09_9BURK|nr:flagellar protein FlaG [Collimonas arenae]AMO98859.1 flaG family protein [Collimonas arenae]AMP08755.1 flaG family protein [Collimonas arenae]
MAMPIDAGSASKLPLVDGASASAEKQISTPGSASTAMAVDAVGKREPTDAVERAQIKQKVDDINRQLQLKSVSVQFQIEPGYKDVVLKVVDQQDGKVVLQIPSEEVVRIAKVMDQLKGVLLEKTA